MSIANHNNQTHRIAGILAIGLLLLSGCNRSSLNPAAIKKELLPGTSRPVRVSSRDVDAAEPAIAASPDGSVYVAWVNHGSKTQADVMIARFTGDGQMHGSAVRVNPQPGIAAAWRGDPPTVAVAPDHTVFVGWTARIESDSGHTTNIYLSSSRDHAQTFGAPVKVNDDPKPADRGMHSLTVGKDGRVYLAWLDERNVTMKDIKMAAKTAGHHKESNREVLIAASTDGGRSFTKNQRVARDACPCCKTALAINSDDRLYVSWRQVLPGDLRHIAISSSADHAQTFTTPVIVSDDQWVLAGCPVSGATLSVDKNRVLRVLWYSEGKIGETGLYWSESKDNGATFAPRRLLAAGPTKGTPVLLAGDGDLTGVWESDSNVVTTKLEMNATPSPSLLARAGELPAAAATENSLFTAYLEKSGQHRSVWLLAARNEQLLSRIR